MPIKTNNWICSVDKKTKKKLDDITTIVSPSEAEELGDMFYKNFIFTAALSTFAMMYSQKILSCETDKDLRVLSNHLADHWGDRTRVVLSKGLTRELEAGPTGLGFVEAFKMLMELKKEDETDDVYKELINKKRLTLTAGLDNAIKQVKETLFTTFKDFKDSYEKGQQ